MAGLACSVALFWPLLSSYSRGAVPTTARVANSAGLFLSFVVYAATLVIAYRLVVRAPAEHGFPARIIVPCLNGEKNVKWIDRIEVSNTNVKGFYENQGWGPDFSVQTQSRFTAPAFDGPLPLAPVTLRGTAFAGDRGVSKIEVSADDGATWQTAVIDYAGTRLTWNLWSLLWTPTRPGDHRLVVRATDGTGAIQTDKERSSGPEGATGLHKVTARIT